MAPRKVNKTDPRNVAKPVSQLRGAAKQNRINKVTKAEAGPATVRGGMAPGAGTTVRKPATQVSRNAKAVSQRMSGIVKAAQTARDVAGVVKSLTRGGAVAAGLKATNTAKGTLSEARQKYGAKAMPQKQGPSQKTTQSSFNKKTFDQAFKAARTSGAKEFTWRGKRYNTKLRGE